MIELQFYERHPLPSSPGRWSYDPVGSLPTAEQPPRPGDYVAWPGIGGTVVRVGWYYPKRGSINWPHASALPTGPTLVYVIIDPGPGPFADEGSE